MTKIQITAGLTSDLRSDFNLINFIEIEDKPFAVGGFGEVYHCLSINGIIPTVKQVVKIFIDNSKGSAEHNFKTTQRLQKKIEQENQILLHKNNKSLVEEYPAFRGLPQYSFRGIVNGKQVIGFTSDNLVSLGFKDFEHFLQDANLLNQYQQFPIERKMLIAYQLVSAFKVLEEFHFIHADLKPGALFINLNSSEIAIIDYDSGVITENISDEPLTWGAANDWVAPEIWEQQTNIQKGEKIKVDIYSDRWSVAIGVHYLITTFHPLFYLTELSPKVANQYFTPQNQWPNVNKNASYFQKANEEIYDQYLPWINSSVPKTVRDKISHTINYGYKNPVARTSYNDWKIALKAIQNPPIIKYFAINKTAVITTMDVELTWHVENAHTVSIDNGIGEVQYSGSINTKPTSDTTYKISVIGYFGQSSEIVKVRVFPTPIIESLKVPMPDFNSKINLNQIKASSPIIDVSMNLSFHNQTLRLTDPSSNLKTLKATYKPKHPLFNLSSVYESIRRKISR